MSTEDDQRDFVEVNNKKKKKRGFLKAILRFFGSNVGLFIILRQFIVTCFISISIGKL